MSAVAKELASIAAAAATEMDTIDFDEVVELYDPVIGLEVHVELNTATKMFCSCSARFGAEPNTHVCPVCLGLPGALPVVNAAAVESAIRIGLALNCEINQVTRFARKNYFYPDMTKNFQTSQAENPIAVNGYLDVTLEDGAVFRVEIERAHMEEDAGKLVHVGGSTGRIQGADYSLADYNRAGIPLIEIVTRPLYGAGERAPEVARAYVGALRELMQALKVSDARMEQGSLRCDANVSLRPRAGADRLGPEQLAVKLGTRTETKNVNSLRSVHDAVRYEMTRQAAVLESGRPVLQETRHWNEGTGITGSGRPKSDADDYRYFPEPDLLPIVTTAERIEQLRATLPEPPGLRRERLQGEWGFTDLEMRDVVGAGALDLIDESVLAGASPAGARKWWLGEVLRRANAQERELVDMGLAPADVAELEQLVSSGRLSDAMARQVLEGVLAGEGTPTVVADARGLAMVNDDSALQEAVDAAIAANPSVAEKIRGGKVQAAGALIGQVMKATKGSADAARVRELILETLGVEG